MADPSRGVYEGDLAIPELLAQTVLLTGSQAQLRHRSFRPACGNPQESGGALKEQFRTWLGLVRFLRD
jgi:hypothetical protein